LDKLLHIICLDIPFPANYGGAIDQYYKIKALSEAGWQIILHCFAYGERTEPQQALDSLCKEVHYYKRNTGMLGLHHSLPYIVSSRSNTKLLARLQDDKAPIWFEGVHTTFFLNHPSLSQRKKIIRIHNIEADYYHQLGLHTEHFLKKMYYFFEAGRLKLYEKSLGATNVFASISHTELLHFQKLYPTKTHVEIPAFHAFDHITSQLGYGPFCLYHGNLEIAENDKVALFLAQEVFHDMDIRIVIAGKNPTKELRALASNQVQVVANPSDHELNELMHQAHIHILPAWQNTGFKLKLLNSLFTGRHVLVNHLMLDGTGLDALVHQADTATEFKLKIKELMSRSFEEHDLELRKEQLEPFRIKNLVAKLETALLGA
jgi:hypothetical protein